MTPTSSAEGRRTMTVLTDLPKPRPVDEVNAERQRIDAAIADWQAKILTVDADIDAQEARIVDLDAARLRREPVDADTITRADERRAALAREKKALGRVLADDQQKRADLDREFDAAQAEEALAEEQLIDVGLVEAGIRLAEAMWAAIDARTSHYGYEVGRHQRRVANDQLADRTGISRLRRGVQMFDAFYFPFLDRLGEDLIKLCNSLNITVVDGKAVPRERRTANATTSQPLTPTEPTALGDDQVDDLDADEDDEGRD